VEQGFYIAATNIVAMLGYGSEEKLLMKAIQNDSPGVSDSEVLKSSQTYKRYRAKNGYFVIAKKTKVMLGHSTQEISRSLL
jgi:hypothetical protein